MAKIENHKYSVEEAFRECFYVVPDYQREYVWTDTEIQQLLDDINEQIDEGTSREYFVGTVLVSPRDQKNHYDVIDGQQRLTTFYLLLCALKHLFEGEPQVQTISGLISTSYTSGTGETQTTLKLEPRYENAGDVMAKIVELNADPLSTRNGIQGAGITSFGSLENLVNAYGTLCRYLSDNYDNKTKLKKFWGYLANNVVFIQISTDVSSALKIFETINERGVGLNPMDLLKNLLFTHVRMDEFTRLKNEWKKITKPLEVNKEKPLRFLRYFLMANYKIQSSRGDAVVREDEIYNWFVNKANAKLCNYSEKPFEFVRKVIQNVENYIAFSDGLGNDKKSSIAMSSLKLLCGGAFSLHYVLLLAASSLPKHLFDHLVRQLESFLFYYIFTKTPTKDLERNFSTWADELRAIVGIPDPQTQADKLNAFIAERFKKNMSAKDGELSDALKRYTLYSMQQYRTRYLLAKLAQHVDMAYKGLREPGALRDYTVLEIEHILPNNPKPDLRADFAEKNPKAEYEEYKIKLGNLTLLEKPINIVASNNFFALKKAEYAKCKNYLTSSIAGLASVGNNSSITRINSKLESFTEWTAANIDRRQGLLINLTKEVWDISQIASDSSAAAASQAI
ncbi:MAG: hypothetical protein AUJ52_14845 [Elusimicrobia bacterium CG1_02_63_36]|nr:MAG: hypothetical protein AUJ52_14845 [Elusimicrobia bacterium CG1_02_63_36]PIP81921.1 MAG: hypothetical protein COR54_17655 [Elusimicrobia bacterium CG22_combo_CG10-13_8_21_14_all_63_91]PJA18697.1 MAG: hypothetical protein COX66_00325 [Elusimicrobia bacterium CG_4_10_14_0_2_um_filter_63_34]PJB24968.1 MAG: hypothetical protein CO113_11040 [Elusimicrobia bacterium CG_4_9_14_3_um_filter_62_55]